MIDKVKLAQVDDEFHTIVKEADLSGHLKNHQPKMEPGIQTDETVEKEEEEEELPLSATDYELYEALNVLKGLTIIKR